MTTYHHYTRDNLKWFFGLSGWQLSALAVGSLPVFAAIKQAAWSSAVLLLLMWCCAVLLVLVPVRGRTAPAWCVAAIAHALGVATGWTRFEARAARGHAGDLDVPDLPGVLQGIRVHEGPAVDPTRPRVAIIHDRANRTWAVTAAIVHPGIGLADAGTRQRYGAALSDLLDIAARTDMITEVLFISRTVPEDGAERDLWVREHTCSTRGGGVAQQVTDELAAALTGASVRHEHFISLVVPEARIARPARAAGGGIEGRSRELHLLMSEVEAQLRGAMAMSDVRWLSSAELALACRTAFAPEDRLGVVQARARAAAATHDEAETVAAVPWAMAGPSAAEATARHYTHDAWRSISVTLALPPGGITLGALAAAVTPTEAGERRSLMVAYPITRASTAQRRSASTEWAADTGLAVRSALGMKARAQLRDNVVRARDMDARLSRGHAMIRPYAVCTVTVPDTVRISEFGRRLDASVRRCGYAPLRLDLAQDSAFVTSTVPLGVSLASRGLT